MEDSTNKKSRYADNEVRPLCVCGKPEVAIGEYDCKAAIHKQNPKQINAKLEINKILQEMLDTYDCGDAFDSELTRAIELLDTIK